MNQGLHITAIVQIRHDTEGRAHYRRKVAAGKTRGVRALASADRMLGSRQTRSSSPLGRVRIHPFR